MDKVCFIILNYNNYQDTIDCVRSLQSSIENEKFDIIVVDNNSSNDSIEKLKNSLNNIEVIPSRVNHGYANGNNIGIKIAEKRGYPFICILNNDTLIEEDFLTACVQKLHNDNSIAFVSPALVEYKNRDLIQSTGGDIFLDKGYVTLKNHHLSRKELPAIVQSDYIGGACMLFRTRLLKEIGYIPENYFLFFEETEWCYKATLMGYKNICLTNYFIYHKGSVSIKSVSGLQEYLMNRNRVVFVKRNIGSRYQFIKFLLYLYARFLFRLLIGKENNIRILKYYWDGVTDRIDAAYPFIVIKS